MWVGRENIAPGENPSAAHRVWWDENSEDYLAEHGETLGDVEFIWGPEGATEDDLNVLGDLTNSRVLEFGCGAAQCSRALAKRGVAVLATDISPRMLRAAARLNTRYGINVPLLAADVLALPFDSGSFDAAFTSFGAFPFIEDLGGACTELARVLRPGGTLAYSTPHPTRWMFPDSPTRDAMIVTTPYFDRRAYVERNDDDALAYVEFHHTLADHSAALAAAGFVIERIWEPEWPADRTLVWGGWGPERSPWIPGTLIIRARKL
ncbi:MAG: class I SAM-dependent methyltransferase [Ancrocorticia sp.]